MFLLELPNYQPSAHLGTVLVAGATTYLLIRIILRLYSAFHGPLSLYPGPPLRALSSVPKILSLVLGRDHTDLVALHARYGPIVRVAPNELSFSSGHNAFQDIYGFKKASQTALPKDPIYYGGGFFKENTFLANADDAAHARLRKTVSHAFADRSLRELEPLLATWARRLVEKLGESTSRNRTGSVEQIVDMVNMFNCTTFDIMGDLAFNEDLGMLSAGTVNDWARALLSGTKSGTFIRALKSTSGLACWFVDHILSKQAAALPEVRRIVGYVNERLYRRMQSTPARPDLWTQILTRGDLSMDEHEGLAFFFMVAGTETTASALSAAVFYLTQSREHLRRVTSEVRDAFASVSDITLETLAHLPVLTAVLNETLRMYPPVPSTLPRCTPVSGATVCGQRLPGNIVVGVHHLATYRNPSLFRDADQFRPERWLNDPLYASDALQAVEPFHVGPRNCVGKNLAWHEMRLLLAAVLFEYDIELTEPSRDWVDRQRVWSVWAKPSLWCSIRQRGTSGSRA